jgi:hypothetical protein
MIINIDREKFISGLEEIIDDAGCYEGLYYHEVRNNIYNLLKDCIVNKNEKIVEDKK